MRLYLVCTFLLTAVGLLGVATFNYAVDPTRHWHPPALPASEWRPDEVLTVPDQRDERSLRLREIQALPFRPDIVLLGSSRVLLVDESMFAGVKVFNAGMSSARISDFVHIWLALLAHDRVPQSVLIFVDAEMLNTNGSAGGDWRTRDSYRDFLAAHNLAARESLSRRIAGILGEGADLLNGALTWRSVAQIAGEWTNHHSRIWSLESADRFPSADTYAYRLDGSLLYKLADMLPKEDRSRVDVPPATHYIYQDYLNWSLSARDTDLLSALLQDMKTHGTTVSVLFPPISEAFYSKLKGQTGYRKSTSSIESLLADAKRRRLVSNVCFIEDAATAGCRKDEMMDFVHTLKPCIRRVLQQCAADGQLNLPLAPFSDSYY